jgi:hypothetical protein
MPDTKILAPRFEPVTVADKLKDGYWLQAVDINGNGKPDLVTSGLALGEVYWYENPTWKRRHIATFPKPVAIDAADVDGDGHIDLVISHDYGTCMYNCKPEDGKISWMRNPGASDLDRPWEVRFIADLMATHRLRFGHFTHSEQLELLALPVVGPKGVHEPILVSLYKKPDDVLNASRWEGTVLDDSSYRVIHGVMPDKFAASRGSTLDSVLLASEEGISWFYYGPDEHWHIDLLGTGELTEEAKTHFKGSGNVAYGRIGNDPYAYIATVEPFHGNTVAVYHKETPGLLSEARWKRTVLDVYADPNESGEGPGHHVVCADFDGDGDDEFLVALRGPMPWQGVFYYKAIDVVNGLWVKTRVSTASAARIAVADFDGDGRLDFATTGYYTPGYFLCDDPRVMVYLNKFGAA